MGVKPKTTMFTIAFDERQPKRMYCATSGGECSQSGRGEAGPNGRCLREATQVYAMGCA